MVIYHTVIASLFLIVKAEKRGLERHWVRFVGHLGYEK